MLPLSDLFPDMTLMVPGCPTTTMERALREAARQFCRETYAVFEATDPETTTAGEPEIDLKGLVAGQKEVVAVLEVLVDGIAARPQSRDWLRASNPAYASLAPGRPRGTYRTGETKLTLWPTPDAAYEVQFTVATAPTAGATQLEDDLVNRWKFALIGRATALLSIQPDVSYSNPKLHDWGMAQYLSGVGKARIELNRSFGREARVLVRSPSFI